jgi:quinol monooxygenase YgiN
MAYVVLARWVARDGEEEAVAAVIDQLIGPTRAEPGNLVYQAHRDPADPHVFVLYEAYVDEAAYAAHGASDHFRRLAIEDGIPRLAARERQFLTTWD